MIKPLDIILFILPTIILIFAFINEDKFENFFGGMESSFLVFGASVSAIVLGMSLKYIFHKKNKTDADKINSAIKLYAFIAIIILIAVMLSLTNSDQYKMYLTPLLALAAIWVFRLIKTSKVEKKDKF